MSHSYEIGTSYGGMKNLADLTTPVPAPKSNFVDYSRYVDVGDGTVRGAGWAAGEWRWSVITRPQRDQLKAFCAGASAAVYIKTRKNDQTDAYQVYTAIMVWPQEEDKEYSKRLDFVIQFRKCVPYSP